MNFDAYEFVAVIIPGALPTLAASLLVPEVAAVLSTEGVELGEFGIFLIVSFVVGHVVHMFGNGIEALEDRLGVGRSSLLFSPTRRPVTPDQWVRFEQVLQARSNASGVNLSHDTWFSTAREIYSQLNAEGRTRRLDAFTRTYGLCRGMVAGSLLTSLLILLLGGLMKWHLALLVFGLIAVPLYIRMRRFSALYAGELISQFLALKQ
ncbi:hypothetical protein ACGYK1_16400 [Sulfitobacter sp. 1A13191]|uniref:hypothetical protein n=1 Tax=Sulfitobacter sp. 1A13191 TaxID=3368589 RepID=UPI003745A8C2